MADKKQCFHHQAEWNYLGKFGHCPECGSAFSDVRFVLVRAGAGRVRRVVRSVVEAPSLSQLIEQGSISID